MAAALSTSFGQQLSGSRACPPSFGRQLLVRPQPLHLRTRGLTASRILATARTASTFKIIIQGRRLPVTDAIKSYVQDKLSRAVHNFGQNIKKIDVTLSARGGDTGTHGRRQQKVDVTVYTLRNGVVRVEDSEDNLYASIDLVCDKVQRKLRQIKEKIITKRSLAGELEEQEFKEYVQSVLVETQSYDEESSREAEMVTAPPGEEPQPLPAAVVRSKVLYLQTQTVEQACEAIEAVGHNFYVFREPKGTVQVVYKRDDGGYGLIVPVQDPNEALPQ